MSKSPQTRPLGPAHLRPITIEIPTTWSPEQALAEPIGGLRQFFGGGFAFGYSGHAADGDSTDCIRDK